MVALSRGERLHGDGGQEQVVVLPCLWHLNLCYRSHDISQATDFNIQEEKARYFYTMAVEFKSNKIIAMHVLQRLVYISGTNDAYVMIQNVVRVLSSGMHKLASNAVFFPHQCQRFIKHSHLVFQNWMKYWLLYILGKHV